MIRAAGLVLVSAYLNDLDEWRAHVKSINEPLTVTLIAGDADGRAVQQNQRLADLLREAGAEVDLQIYPNMGHAFPDDWKKVLGRALGVLAHS
jgi:dipeptidyl aminopeptidase/acylaminoacyl peptidase